MMLQIILYATAVAAAMAAVGVALERVAISRRWPRRAMWAALMLMSLLFPLQSIWRAEPGARSAPAVPAALNEAPGAVVEPGAVMTGPGHRNNTSLERVGSTESRRTWNVPLPSDGTVAVIWGLTSLFLLLYLAIASRLLRRRAAVWQLDKVLGEPVFVSNTAGPALFGVLRPRIVVPRWFLGEPAQTQALILAHEQQHLRARDPLLLWSAVLLVVAVPWNLPLWWQLRRLRLAIEMDCDERVLKAGAEPDSYGKVLVVVTRRALGMPAGVIAMSEPASALEQRIRNLVPVAERFRALRMAGSVGLATVAMGAAAALEAPPMPGVGMRSASGIPVLSLSAPIAPDPVKANRASAPQPPRQDSAQARPEGGREPDITPAAPRLTSPLSPARYDGWRFSQYLQNMMLQNHPELLRPANQAEVNQVTILLTPDGKVDRQFVALIPRTELFPVPAAPSVEEVQRYAEVIAGRLNIYVSRIGAYGVTFPARVVGNPASGINSMEMLTVVFAWPRRPGESAPTFMADGQMLSSSGSASPAARTGDSFDAAAAQALVEQYLPDAFSGKNEAAGIPVIVLSRQGEVIRAGRSAGLGSSVAPKLVQDPQLLGIHTSEVSWRTVRNAAGERADVLFAWQSTGETR